MPIRSLALSTAGFCLSTPVLAEEVFPATLPGHALIPAATFIAPPADAPTDAGMSGKVTGAAWVMEPESVMGDTGASHGTRATGIMLPLKGQAVQGLSGLYVRRIGHIDLRDIADPDGRARLETVAKRDLAGKFTFPFFTIENVMPVDDSHITAAADNNLPYASGRALDKAADNEIIFLSVPEFLAAK